MFGVFWFVNANKFIHLKNHTCPSLAHRASPSILETKLSEVFDRLLVRVTMTCEWNNLVVDFCELLKSVT